MNLRKSTTIAELWELDQDLVLVTRPPNGMWTATVGRGDAKSLGYGASPSEAIRNAVLVKEAMSHVD